jgi:hypothetical protein
MSSIRSVSCIRPTCQCRCPPLVSTVSCSYPNVPMQLIIVFKFNFLLCKNYFLLCLLGQSFIFRFKFSWPSCHTPPMSAMFDLILRLCGHWTLDMQSPLLLYLSSICAMRWSSYPLNVRLQLLLCPCHHPAVFCQFQFLPRPCSL